MALTQKEVAKNYVLDFFHLPADYHLRIARYSDAQLKKSEIVKTRICYSCMCSVISGTAFAVPTHGGSAFICIWAARRWYVASRKLGYIKAELTRRGITLRAFLHRDWMIPASIAIVAVSIGMGVTTGVEGIVSIGHPNSEGAITLHSPASGASNGTEAGTTHIPDPHLLDPSSLKHIAENSQLAPFHDAAGHSGGHSLAAEWFAGFKDQLHSLFSSSHHAIAGVTADGTYQSAVAWVTGANSAQMAEKQFVVLLGQQMVSMMCERLDAESLIPKRLRGVSCPRMPWAVDNICSRCEEPIQSGKFYHCCECECDDGEFSVCIACHMKQSGCYVPNHENLLVQTALPGRFFLPEEGIKDTHSIAGPKTLACNACGDKITRRWYYDCWDCRKTGLPWIQCLKCYKSGRSCVGDNTHSFYAFQRAIFAGYNDPAPYQKQGPSETGQATCSICHALVSKGPYYHCPKCEKGKFDICSHCFSEGEHCRSNDHILTKYYAWKYKRSAPKEQKSGWKCSNPQCQFREDKRYDFYFSCREGGNHEGHYGICPPCYFLDFLCPDEEHDMYYKCVFR